MRIALLASTSCAKPKRLALRDAFSLWRSRRTLAALDPAQLEDVGITPIQARVEARRPVWDAPASWKC